MIHMNRSRLAVEGNPRGNVQTSSPATVASVPVKSPLVRSLPILKTGSEVNRNAFNSTRQPGGCGSAVVV
ncbi:hypothetical protein HYFRA_00001785 [Hymenoscyphus fraxineus]|uniref:Uncharacterized protein n=1 Tax=Hymenoscyphus fraxineus TaxID=746836 RepID=A0A9N9PM90_9HELO|nr:hypothetical protein HYFRA_00001785 [Hymenoscyphus fraxineus]